MTTKRNKRKSRKKATNKSIGKSLEPKKDISKIENLTAKKISIIYRDKKGRIVKPEKLNGTIEVKWELWRYTPNPRGKNGKKKSVKYMKYDFGRKWEPRFRKLKKAKTQKEILKLTHTRFSRHKIEVKMIDGEIFVYTANS